jgi:hypothetical protein
MLVASQANSIQRSRLCPGRNRCSRPVSLGTSDNLASVKLVPIWQQLQDLAVGFPASEKGVSRA